MHTLSRVTLVASFLACAAFVAPAAPPAAPEAPSPSFSDPTTFTNAFAPFQPGSVSVYTGRSQGAAVIIVALQLAETRIFDVGGTPVECVTLQETEFEDGVLAELSLNYFAQADDGAVYYFGELSTSYVDGAVASHEGSWLVGGPTQNSDAAETATALVPAVFMPPAPVTGDSWVPEHVPPIADETVTVEATEATVKVRAGKFTGVIVVHETSELPDAEDEHKWYAPGVGMVKSKAQGERLQLASTMLSPP